LKNPAVEDPIAQARRHVAEAEQHVARLESLILRLSNDERHAALAAEAREILATLKQTLSLALQHLELERKR
jgi:exonuclease VII small subunit